MYDFVDSLVYDCYHFINGSLYYEDKLAKYVNMIKYVLEI